MINEFQGENRFLSNFWPAKVRLDGIEYKSVEHAYVAAKTTDTAAREQIAGMTPGQAKRFGRTLSLRPDWEQIKLTIMRELVSQKFTDPKLAKMLKATGDQQLVEGNTWGDTFWGVCKGKGQNNLGKILMAVRAGLK